MEILYTSSDVHMAIKRIFRESKSVPLRRVAVVAYLGASAEKFLPYPENLEIICNPEPGATDPASIRSLISKGAKIQFSDNLHSKVYWSEKGCIITSANISCRALGKSNQKETGILIDSKKFDIDRLIAYAEPYKLTTKAMNKLELSDRAYKRAHGIMRKTGKVNDYLTWYSTPEKPPWKIGYWYESHLTAAKSAYEKSMKVYHVKEPEDFLDVAKNQVKSDEWLLCFKVTDKGVSDLEWMYADFVVPVSTKDRDAYDKEYPFQVVQVFKLKNYPYPPFSLTKEFRMSFDSAVKQYGIEKIVGASKLDPSNRLLKYIAENLVDNQITEKI